MHDRSPLFTGPSDVDWLVADHARSQAVPRTFLPYGDEDPQLAHRLDALMRRVMLDADVAVAVRTADATLTVAVVVWRAIRALFRPLFRERPVVVVRPTADAKDVSEAA